MNRALFVFVVDDRAGTALAKALLVAYYGNRIPLRCCLAAF